MISNEEINELAELHKNGSSIESVIIAAYYNGRIEEIVKAVAALGESVEPLCITRNFGQTCGQPKGAHSVGQLQCPMPGRHDFYQWSRFRTAAEQERANERAMQDLDRYFEQRGGCFDEYN